MGTINEFVFPLSAEFYKVEDSNLFNTNLKQIPSILEKEKDGNWYCKAESVTVSAGNCVYWFYSFRRKKKIPLCLDHSGKGISDIWKESKFAYLFIIKKNEMVAICKENVSNIRKLRASLSPIDCDVMSSVFVDDYTVFQRFGMTNLDISKDAMRSKSVEADNLSVSFPILGANTYKLNSYRKRQLDTKNIMSVSISSSKVNEIGKKVDYNRLIDWVSDIFGIIKGSKSGSANFLSVFAKPINFKTCFSDIKANKNHPNSIFFLFSNFLDELEDTPPVCFRYIEDEVECIDIFPLEKVLEIIGPSMEIKQNGSLQYHLESEFVSLSIEITIKGLMFEPLHSGNFYFEKDGIATNLIEYMIDNGYYVVHFDDPIMNYSGGQMYQDHQLLGRYVSLLNIFEPDNDLNNVKSEKGTFGNNQTDFDNDSIFSYCEKKYQTTDSIMVCDDLGTEWADFIQIGPNYVRFYAAKYTKTKFSASSFHEVISQAQKNLGNFMPLSSALNQKKSKWGKNYQPSIKSGGKGTKINTKIPRVRTPGKTSTKAVNMWKSAMSLVDYRKDTFIVMNSVSKKELSHSLKCLLNKKPDEHAKEALSILWLLSSFVSACQTMNIGVHVTCRK